MTPLVDAASLAAELGLGKLWVKVESERLDLPSFKILGASWAVYRAVVDHVGEEPAAWETVADLAAWLAPHRPLALAAATDGNHGRAVARMAALLGLEARVFVPAGTAEARIAAIESEGASCTIVEGTYGEAVARAAAEAGPDCLVISDTSSSDDEPVPGWVIEGYGTIFEETERELAGAGLDAVVIPVGVGALSAAAIRFYRAGRAEPAPALIAVEPLAARCVLESVRAGRIVSVPDPHGSIMAGLNCDEPSAVAWPVVSTGFDYLIAIDDEPAREAMRALAREGVVAGETGAAALAGLTELLGGEDAPELRDRLVLGPDARVLVLCTEGATDPAAYAEIVSGG